jgi:hypothetical protein
MRSEISDKPKRYNVSSSRIFETSGAEKDISVKKSWFRKKMHTEMSEFDFGTPDRASRETMNPFPLIFDEQEQKKTSCQEAS